MEEIKQRKERYFSEIDRDEQIRILIRLAEQLKKEERKITSNVFLENLSNLLTWIISIIVGINIYTNSNLLTKNSFLDMKTQFGLLEIIPVLISLCLIFYSLYYYFQKRNRRNEIEKIKNQVDYDYKNLNLEETFDSKNTFEL